MTKKAEKQLELYKKSFNIGDKVLYYPVITDKTNWRPVTISSEPFLTSGNKDIGIFVKEVSGYVIIEAIKKIPQEDIVENIKKNMDLLINKNEAVKLLEVNLNPKDFR